MQRSEIKIVSGYFKIVTTATFSAKKKIDYVFFSDHTQSAPHFLMCCLEFSGFFILAFKTLINIKLMSSS